MQKPEHLLKNLIKQERKSEESLDIPNSFHFKFPCVSYLKSVSSFEEDQNTYDISSECNDSEFDTSEKKPNKRGRKPKNSNKNKNSVKEPAVKVKKQEVKIEKSEDSIKDEYGSVQQLRQEIQIGIDNSGPIPEKTFLKSNKKGKRNAKSKSKKLNTEGKEQAIPKKQLKSQVETEEQPKFEEPLRTHINYLTSICDFQIVDFKYRHAREQFQVEKDVFYVFEPKMIKQCSQKEDIPRQLILTGEKVCESKELFGELLKFYRGLSRDVGLTKQ